MIYWYNEIWVGVAIVIIILFLFVTAVFSGWKIGQNIVTKQVIRYIDLLETVAKIQLTKDIFKSTNTYIIREHIRKLQKEIDEIQK